MGRRGRAAQPVRRQPARKRKERMVYLDGASSSDNEQHSSVTPVKMHKDVLHITESPDKMSRGIMSDSSELDSDCELDLNQTKKKSKKDIPVTPSVTAHLNNNSGSDSSDDIFNINYSARNHQALRGAYKELTVTEKEQSQTQQQSNAIPSSDTSDNDDDCRIEEQPITSKRSSTRNKVGLTKSPPSPTLFEIDKNVQREESCRSTRRRTRSRMSLVQELSEKQGSGISPYYNHEMLNLSSDVFISDGEDEEDVNPEIRVRIKWGSQNFRLPIKKLQKFSHLYEVLSQKYGVSTNRIVLNLNDRIINPEHCPADLGVTIADFIDGGIQLSESQSFRQQPAPQMITQDPDSIAVRVQCSNKKASLTINIGLKEKMSVLMHKYAEEKRLNLDKLRFMFDGEVVSTRSTPSTLDMEGGECIDVYELS